MNPIKMSKTIWYNAKKDATNVNNPPKKYLSSNKQIHAKDARLNFLS